MACKSQVRISVHLLAMSAFAISVFVVFTALFRFTYEDTNLDDIGQDTVPSHHPLFLRGNSWRISDTSRIRVIEHSENNTNIHRNQRNAKAKHNTSSRCAAQAPTASLCTHPTLPAPTSVSQMAI